MKQYFPRISSLYTNLLALLNLQLALFLLSLPVLIWWGISISVMTLIATPLFTPFLTIFLFLSTLIFILTLLFIPCLPLFTLLDIVSAVWIKLLSAASSTFLIELAMPHPVLLLLLSVFHFLLLFHTRSWHIELRVLL